MSICSRSSCHRVENSTHQDVATAAMLQATRQHRPSKPLREARIGQLAHSRGKDRAQGCLSGRSRAEIWLLEERNAKARRCKDAKVVDLAQRSGHWKKGTQRREGAKTQRQWISRRDQKGVRQSPHARWWVARQSPLHPPYGKPSSRLPPPPHPGFGWGGGGGGGEGDDRA